MSWPELEKHEYMNLKNRISKEEKLSLSFSESHGTYLREDIDEKLTLSSSSIYDSSYIGQEKVSLDQRNAILFNVNDPNAFCDYMQKQMRTVKDQHMKSQTFQKT